MQAEQISGEGNPHVAFCIDEVDLFSVILIILYIQMCFFWFYLRILKIMGVCYTWSEELSALQDPQMDASQIETPALRAEPMEEEYARYLQKVPWCYYLWN